MKTYQVTLPDEVAAFVDRVLAEKLYASFDELVECALSGVEAELAIDKHQDVDALRESIQLVTWGREGGADLLRRGASPDQVHRQVLDARSHRWCA